MTREFIDDMIERFKENKRIHKKYVRPMIRGVLTSDFPNIMGGQSVTHARTDDGGNRRVQGSYSNHLWRYSRYALQCIINLIAGQFYDVLEIFRKNGYPSETHHYLFNGDFVDRGSWSTEVALLLYSFKALYPKGFFINRGNHETDDMNKMYGFEGECRAK